MSRKRKHPRRLNALAHKPPPRPPGQFFAQPPPEGVSRREWARAFLEAQSPDPEVRQRGRDTLTDLGCDFMDGTPPNPPDTTTTPT